MVPHLFMERRWGQVSRPPDETGSPLEWRRRFRTPTLDIALAIHSVTPSSKTVCAVDTGAHAGHCVEGIDRKVPPGVHQAGQVTDRARPSLECVLEIPLEPDIDPDVTSSSRSQAESIDGHSLVS